MPLDDPTRFLKKIDIETKPEVRIIDKMIKRLSDPARWHQGSLCDDIGGAVCLVGAYRLAVSGNLSGAAPLYDEGPRARVQDALRSASGTLEIAFWNDAPHTTHADIMRVLNRAREILLAERS